MTATAHVYEIFITRPVASGCGTRSIDPEYTTKYFHGTRFESTFEPGAPFVNRIVDADRTRRRRHDRGVRAALTGWSMTWHVLYDVEMAEEPPGRVEWTLTSANADDSVTRVTLRHGDLAMSPKTWESVRIGWVADHRQPEDAARDRRAAARHRRR